MPHKNFYQFKAENNFDLGFQMGKTFSSFAIDSWNTESLHETWQKKKERAKRFITFNEKFLPEYLDEIRGYAEGAGVPLVDMYTLCLEDEVDEDYPEKCTTVITNNGQLFAHNEDWDSQSKDKICVVEKQIKDLSIFELFYCNTLGGNSVSVNSNGYIIGINSLVSKNTRFGLSKNIITRWMQEIKDPNINISELKKIPRSVGYNYNILNKKGDVINIEYNSKHLAVTMTKLPFIHTNHYLTELSVDELNTDKNGTFTRYETAKKNMKSEMNITEIIDLSNDTSSGPQKSIMNERTISKIIVDTKKKVAKIWLLRENELGWVDYDLKKYFI